MKKYYLNTTDIGATHLIHSTNVVYLRNKHKKNYHILEDNGYYDNGNEQEYLISLNKRKLLRQWEKWRAQVKVAPHLPEIIQLIIYENAFDDLKTSLIQSYQEDTTSSINSQSIQKWFSEMKAIATNLNRKVDVSYWNEMNHYFHTCFQLNVLTDKLESSPKDH